MNRYLMSPPGHFSSHFLFNPWMDWQEQSDAERAGEQWHQLRGVVTAAGGEVVAAPANPAAPAMTFTRDGAFVYDAGRALVLRNDEPRGSSEPPLIEAALRDAGLSVETMPAGTRLEGGNVLPCTDGRVLVGLKPGSSGLGEKHLAALVDRSRDCVGLPLADLKYLHLDMVLADLGGRGWLVYPGGLGPGDLSRAAWSKVFGDRPIIEVDRDDAARLACNVVIVGDIVITGWASPALTRAIESLGFDVAVTPLDEFRKAGGGPHCLTLELDPSGAANESTSANEEEQICASST